MSYLYILESDFTKWIFIGFLGSMIVNAIFPHLIATLLMKRYAPGLLTGLMLNIPISTLGVGVILLALIPLLFKVGGKISPFTHVV